MNFYLLQGMMKNLVSGDMALESLELAEDEYLRNPEEYDDPCPESKKSEVLNSGHTLINDRLYKVFNGNEVNGCWINGDFHFNKNGDFLQVPEFYHLEDLRQNEVIYRPV